VWGPDNDQVWGPDNNQVWGPNNDQVWGPDNNQVWGPDNNQVREPDNDQVWGLDNDQVWGPDTDQVWGPDNDQVWGPENDQVWGPGYLELCGHIYYNVFRCGRLMSNITALRYHHKFSCLPASSTPEEILSVNQSRERFHCSQCDKSFYGKHALERHVTKTHEGRRLDISLCVTIVQVQI